MSVLMLISALVLIVIRVAIFNSDSSNDRKKFLICAAVIFTIILGCRNGEVDYGTDINNYYRAYERAALAEGWESLIETNVFRELGYPVLCFIFSRIIKWPQFIIFFQAAFCCGVTLRYIYKHSNDVLISTLVFMSMGLLQFYMTGFRQSFAIALCFIALELAENKKYFWMIIFILLAVSFHQTALLAIPIFFLIRMRVTKISFVYDLVIFFVLLTNAPWLVETGNTLLETNYEFQTYGNALGGLINVIIEALIIITMFVTMRDVEKGIGLRNTWKRSIEIYNSNGEISQGIFFHYFHVLFIGMALYFLRYQTTTIERVSFYYTGTLMVLLPQVIDNCFSPSSKRELRMIFVAGMLFLIYWRMSGIDYHLF